MDAVKARQILDSLVLQISATYQGFVDTLKGKWLSETVNMGEMPALRGIFDIEIANVRIQAADALAERIKVAFTEASQFAYKLANIDPAMSALTDAQKELVSRFLLTSANALSQVVTVQTISDTEAMNKLHTQFRIGVFRSVREGVSFRNAVISQREQALTKSGFYRLDALGRRWDSTEYVRVEASHALYSFFNLLMVLLLSIRGESQAELAREGEYQTFDLDRYDTEIEPTLHPRSRAVVVPLITHR